MMLMGEVPYLMSTFLCQVLQRPHLFFLSYGSIKWSGQGR
jgi:hypothetical protein